MGQSKRPVNAKPRQSWQDEVGMVVGKGEGVPVKRAEAPAREKHSAVRSCAHFKIASNHRPDTSSRAFTGPAASPGELSVRAENVLKELAVELIGESPPQGRWTPPDLLVQRLTYKVLSTARNCGPQTTAEIIEWAHKRGKNIQRSFYAGKSLSAMWQYTINKFSEGEISQNEVAEALERSTRRGNTRIPVAFQRMLLQFVNSKKLS